MTKSRGIHAPRRRWSDVEIEALRMTYPDAPSAAIAQVLGRTLLEVYRKAKALKLRKSPQFNAGPHARRLRRGDNVGAAYRYPKGHVPANKGTRRPGYAPGRMATTQFKKGQRGSTFVPIGSERINADGYRDRKVSETGYPPRDWVGVHRLLWIEHHGPIPAGLYVVFRDRDKTNITIGNLELISKAENMQRNTIHNLPPELVEVVMLKGRVKRQINKRSKRENKNQ